MNRYFPIYHGLHERAPWGIAVERPQGSPRIELLMLCRTEREAAEHAEQVGLAHAMRDLQKSAERETKGAK